MLKCLFSIDKTFWVVELSILCVIELFFRLGQSCHNNVNNDWKLWLANLCKHSLEPINVKLNKGFPTFSGN